MLYNCIAGRLLQELGLGFCYCDHYPWNTAAEKLGPLPFRAVLQGGFMIISTEDNSQAT